MDSGASAKWWQCRPPRASRDRREQRQRRAARTLQDALKSLSSLEKHRGCRPSKLGMAMLSALRSATVVEDDLVGLPVGISAPDVVDVPSTRLVHAQTTGDGEAADNLMPCVNVQSAEEVLWEPLVHQGGDVLRVPFVQMPLIHPHPAPLVRPTAVAVADASCRTDEEILGVDELTAACGKLDEAFRTAEKLLSKLDSDGYASGSERWIPLILKSVRHMDIIKTLRK